MTRTKTRPEARKPADPNPTYGRALKVPQKIDATPAMTRWCRFPDCRRTDMHHQDQTLCLKHFRRLRKYRLTVERFESMFCVQDGRCGVCGFTIDREDCKIDHDHQCCPNTGSCGECVRGLLCSTCNSGIGCFGDSIERMERAARYVSAHRRAGARDD